MKPTKRHKPPSPALLKRLGELEALAAEREIQIHYDRLEAAGLKLKGGICTIKGEYHIFVDRRQSTGDIIDFLEEHLSQPLPRDAPQHEQQADKDGS